MSSLRIELVYNEHRVLISVSHQMEASALLSHLERLRKCFSEVPLEHRSYAPSALDGVMPEGEWKVFLRSLIVEGLKLELIAATAPGKKTGEFVAKATYLQRLETPPDLQIDIRLMPHVWKT